MEPILILKTLAGAAAKSGVGKAVGAVLRKAKNRYDDWSAGSDALDGGDPLGEGRLESAIERILERLENKSQLSEQARAWAQAIASQAPFVEVFLAEISGNAERSKQARGTLATSYAAYTGEDPRLAEGEISRVIAYVYSQLTTTDSAKHKLNSLLTLRIAADVHELRAPHTQEFPSREEIECFRGVATRLLDAARTTWKMPAFVAPLVLMASEEASGGADSKAVNTQELAIAVREGENIVLWGPGGIGKTVFLLELGGLANASGGRRVALYVDAAVWARSEQSVFTFVADNAVSKAAGLTSEMLAKFADAGYVTLMLNGWNEIPASRKVYCHQQLSQLTSANADLKVVVTTRTLQETPSIDAPRRVEVHGLTWRGQSDVIRAELLPDKASFLLEQLARDTGLRRAARSPLILRGLIAQSQASAAISSNVYDLLGAVVSKFEGDSHRAQVLAESPIFGLHARYLEELSYRLNALGSTNLSRDDAIAVVGQVARRLAEDGHLGAALQPAEMLTVLASQHLLHDQDGVVRFAHQRFQEYFGARRLLSGLDDVAQSRELLLAAINSPAWTDSFELVSAKLQGLGPHGSKQRASLIELARSVDVAYASELAGLSRFSAEDDPTVHDALVHGIEALSHSRLTEVKELAAICKVASRLPVFAQDIWALLETDSWRTALPSRHHSGTWISVDQLGPDVLEHLSAWSDSQFTEFVHEVASSAENFDFVEALVTTGRSQEIRVAAIYALLWSYPASSGAIRAWLTAPIEIQLDSGLLNAIEHLLDEDIAVEEIKAQLKVLAASEAAPKVRVWLASLFPQEYAPAATEQILESLRTYNQYDRADKLLSLARELAPDQVNKLAAELILATGPTPRWTLGIVRDLGSQEREALFEQMWQRLITTGDGHNWPETIGPMASKEQTRRSVEVWLELRESCSSSSRVENPPHDLCREVERILSYAPGDDLVDLVLERAPSADYKTSVRLTGLISQCCKRDAEEPAATQAWVIQAHQVQLLINAFKAKVDGADSLQDEVVVNLAGIASVAAPSEFGTFLLEAMKRQLDAWGTYEERLRLLRGGRRPSNPGFGGFIINSLARWGLDAMPGLLELLGHPNASRLVPEAIGQIAAAPWHHRRDGFHTSVGSDLEEGRRRTQDGLSFKQPTEQAQPVTDVAAGALAALLSAMVEQEKLARAEDAKWNPLQAAFSLGNLTRVLALVPSALIVEPVLDALRTGILNRHQFVAVIRSLIRQGWTLSDPVVIAELEQLFEKDRSEPWLDEPTRYSLNELAQLLVLVEPTNLLAKSPSLYLEQWLGIARSWSLIDSLASLKTSGSWDLLLELGQSTTRSKDELARIADGLVRTLVPERFQEFLQLVSSGRFFSFCQRSWNLEKLAPSLAEVARSIPNGIALLIEACVESATPAADDLLRLVLVEAGESEEHRVRYGLQALDAGRAETSDAPAAHGLKALFTLKVPYESTDAFEIRPKSCNALRLELYRRAMEKTSSGIASRRLLASLECSRREGDRPVDEPRHPMLSDGRAWTDALLS